VSKGLSFGMYLLSFLAAWYLLFSWAGNSVAASSGQLSLKQRITSGSRPSNRYAENNKLRLRYGTQNPPQQGGRSSASIPAIPDAEEAEYYSTITVGDQQLDVAFDTGSSDL
jgi:hypothetical protein